MNKIRVLLADDHTVLRAGLKALLATQPDLEPVGETGEGSEAVRLAATLQPDVLLLDVTMPGNERFAALHAVRERAPGVRVLLLTMHEDEAILREALRAGAAGYVLKKAAEAELLSAIRAVARGEAFVDPAMTRAMIEGYLGATGTGRRPESRETEKNRLTAREIEVLKLIAEGYTNKETAEKLVMSRRSKHTRRILRKSWASRAAWNGCDTRGKRGCSPPAVPDAGAPPDDVIRLSE